MTHENPQMLSEDDSADTPSPDFYQPGHTYANTIGWRFRVDTVTTHPEDGERTALGWRYWNGWEPYAYGEDDYEIQRMQGITDVSAQLLQSPQTAAEADRMRARIAELEAAQGTVFRASHDSIPLRLYTTAAEARRHCETVVRREIPGASLDWIEDEENGVAELAAAFGEDDRSTGYVVTALDVAGSCDEGDAADILTLAPAQVVTGAYNPTTRTIRLELTATREQWVVWEKALAVDLGRTTHRGKAVTSHAVWRGLHVAIRCQFASEGGAAG
ncbi:hypothetical protein ACFXAZ_33240 [Streptomyces sp. NPDC059477]|uniref:hypothetical protein n=1 Tax=Streptomyces sp. NPDC059477 TaxID=3346847 RepID=UPI00368FDD69